MIFLNAPDLSIPLKRVAVTSNLVEPLHTVTVEHLYFVPSRTDVNPAAVERIEAQFKFPLPAGASVTAFTAKYGAVELHG